MPPETTVFPAWLTSYGIPALWILGGLIAAAIAIAVLYLCAIVVQRLARTYAGTRLDVLKLKAQQAQVDPRQNGQAEERLRQELRTNTALLAEAGKRVEALERLNAAQIDAIALREDRLTKAKSETESLRQRLAQLSQQHEALERAHSAQAQQLHAAQQECEQLHAAGGLMQRQLDAEQKNAALLQATVSDLNNRRDLLVKDLEVAKAQLETAMLRRETV